MCLCCWKLEVILGERSRVTFSFENKMHNHCCQVKGQGLCKLAVMWSRSANQMADLVTWPLISINSWPLTPDFINFFDLCKSREVKRKNWHKFHKLFCQQVPPEICWFSGADRERIVSGSGADQEWIPSQSHVISLSQSEAQNRERIRSKSGADQERIGSRSPLKVMWSLWANQGLRKSEWIHSWSTPNPLPRGSAPKSHVISLSRSDVP